MSDWVSVTPQFLCCIGKPDVAEGICNNVHKRKELGQDVTKLLSRKNFVVEAIDCISSVFSVFFFFLLFFCYVLAPVSFPLPFEQQNFPNCSGQGDQAAKVACHGRVERWRHGDE